MERNESSDPRVQTLVTTYGKRALAEWVLRSEESRLRYLAALQEIARWDQFKTLGYEGPKRVAQDALGLMPMPPCPVCGGRGWHTAGGNDPMACGRCPAGEAWASVDPLPGSDRSA